MSEALDIRTDDDGRPTHKANGDFAPGNKWMMPRWQPGQSGKPMQFPPRKLWMECKAYVEEIEAAQVHAAAQGLPIPRLTWAGLARHLGISRVALDKYYKGEIGQDPDDAAGVVTVLEHYRTVMEADLEAELQRTQGQTSGIIFAMKNLFPKAWRDEKHLSVESVEKQRLIVQIDPELRAQLEQQRGETFDAEFTQVTEG